MDGITTRRATEADFEAIVAFDGQIFGEMWTDEAQVLVKPLLELDRFSLAFDADTMVGVAGVYSQEITVPGNEILPAGGVTWVAVAPTHRRRGVLTMMMEDLHRDIDDRGEALAMLTASEGGIYGRFEYGIASHRRVIEIDRRRTSVRAEHQPPPGSVHMTTLDDDRLATLFDRYRRQRNGEIRRTPERFELVKTTDGKGAAVAIHADGYAAWTVSPSWNEGHPEHALALMDLIAITPEAHAALWHTVLSVDLVALVTSRDAMALDDVLPYLLTDPRALRTTNLNDMVWVNIRDIGRCLEARTYGSADEMIIEVDLGERTERWRITGSPDGAEAKKVRSRPDMSLSRSGLGAIYLGGVRPSTLMRAGQLTASSPDIVRRADAFFSADRLPHCATGF